MFTANFSPRQRFTTGLLAGLCAGILATALMLILSPIIGSVSLPDALASAIVEAMPASLFDILHRTFGPDAKHYFFYGVVVGQCLIFALGGGLCNLLVGSKRLKRGYNSQGQLHWGVGVVLASVLWLLTGLVFFPLVGGGIFGTSLNIDPLTTILTLALVGLVFGLLFVFAQNWLVLRQLNRETRTDRSASEYSAKRRSIIRDGLIVLGMGALGIAAWHFISGGKSSLSAGQQADLVKQYKGKITPAEPNYGTFQPVQGLSSEITPNDQYYQVSKNFTGDPSVDSAGWKLSIEGLVASPYTLTYNQLQALPLKKQYESMMCISNEVGGQYMSNALWEGIPLVDLLQRAGTIKPGATKVVLYAADGYSDSIHLTKALEPTTLLALRMNGVALPQAHGFPARLLVPGIYGMKHVKWIERIEVTNVDYQGYWQQGGWSDPAPIRLTSRIDTPIPGKQLTADRQTYVAGVAFSGNQGISEVDVSFDTGKTWQQATLKRPLSPLTWVLWEIPWQPQTGTYNVVVRAIDMKGNVQDPNAAPPAPNGSSGYHTVSVSAL